MMSAQNQLSHNPPNTFACYTENGRNAASKSNLVLASAGPAAIDQYMEDRGAGNIGAGHRRWILFPRQTVMGSGSVGASAGGKRAANALWVIRGGSARCPRLVADGLRAEAAHHRAVVVFAPAGQFSGPRCGCFRTVSRRDAAPLSLAS